MAKSNSPVTTSQTISMKQILDGKRFTIPEIQRDYDWEKNKQSKTLVDDLWRYHLHVQNDVPQYFLGTVIVYDTRKKDDYQIMDGQQRITTIIAMAAAIKSHLEEYAKTAKSSTKKKVKEFIRDEIELAYLYHKVKPRRIWKLKPKDDHVVKLINEMSTLKGRSPKDALNMDDFSDSPNAMRLLGTLGMFYDQSIRKAKKANPDEPYEELMDFFSTFTNKVVATMTTTTTLSIALQMYISVNGPNAKELNHFDLLRGLLIAKAHALGMDDDIAPRMRYLSKDMKPINANRGDMGIERCVRFWVEARTGSNISSGMVTTTLDTEIRGFTRIEDFNEMIDQLRWFARSYQMCDNINDRRAYPGFLQNQRLTAFTGIATWRSGHAPLYASLFYALFRQGLDFDDFDEVMDAVEWVNIRGWSGRDGAELEGIYPWAANKALMGVPLDDWLDEFIEKLDEVLDGREVTGFQHLRDNPVKDRGKARVLIHKIRESIANPGPRSKECNSCRLIPRAAPGWKGLLAEKEEPGCISNRIGNWFLQQNIGQKEIDQYPHPIDPRLKNIRKNAHTKPEIKALGDVYNELVKGNTWNVKAVNKRSRGIIEELETHWPKNFHSRSRKKKP